MAAGTQTRRIIISVDTKGNRDIQDLANQLGGVNKNTKSLVSGMLTLKNAFVGYIGALGLREIASMSDEMQNLGNRLKIVSRASEDTRAVMQGILGVANETNQSISDVGEVYNRLGSALKAVNPSSEALLATTKELINSFRIAGSTGPETTATIIQLSQAFASGTLRGQELRSVMLQNATLAGLLRQKFGANLAADAEKGLIRIADVMRLLRDNMESINNAAKKLTPTFEQTLTKAFNSTKLALYDLNTQFNLSGKFASAMEGLAQRMSLIFTLVGLLAFTQVPALITSIGNLSKALLLLAVENPLIATLTATVALVLLTNDSLDSFIDKLRNLGAWLVQTRVWFLELTNSVQKAKAEALDTIGLGTGSLVLQLEQNVGEIKRLTDIADSLAKPSYRPSPLAPETGANKELEKSKKAIDELIASLDKIKGSEKLEKIKEILGKINAEFLNGAISVDGYNKKLINFEIKKLNRQFKEGKFDIFQYNKNLTELKIQDLNRELKNGVISFAEYNGAVDNLRVGELRDRFEAGKISLIAYNEELVKISQKFEPGAALVSGTQAYITSIGTVSQGIAGAVKNAFSSLEDNLLDFIKTGEFNFAKFTQAILDDLTRIILRATIIKPFADAILGGLGAAGGGGASLPANVAEHGLAFDHGIRKFAAGGIVSSPTTFGYGNGGKGLMGEAGPEAILPLKRGSGGDLGVSATVTPVTINIINQNGSDVKQNETTGPNGEKQIEILITGKVREGIAQGKFDNAFKTSYGLSRKGS